MNERETIDRGWYYVIEPDGGARAPADRQIRAEDGRVLSRRLHGVPGRIEVVDRAGCRPATLLRAAAAVAPRAGAALVRVTLEGAGTAPRLDPVDGLVIDGPALAALGSHHAAEAMALTPGPRPVTEGALPARPTPRALFFESLMNTDMPHNDKEISQGVLHMISGLRAIGTEVVLVNAKMPITGDERPVLGLENLVAAVQGGRIGLVGITLLEGYWDGVCRLIQTLRALGCRAHIAVGGVMPSLAPEHVAAHLPEVSFVCRGAGEYFVPRLCTILGDADIDTPLTDAQVGALLAMDGLIALDRAGGRLLSCRSDRTMQVEDLDRVTLDLSFVEARHIEGGIEVSTSRGCIHKCSFCSILGRESYQARSAGSIIDVLRGYEARFRELHGDQLDFAAPNAFRVHFSDDDFACDRERAKAFFEALPSTRFRLSSIQVAIGDLCRKENGKLLAEPDHELLDTMRADCFADHGRPIPKVDFYEDHRSRSWSSFLQIGVETYSDAEIARLGKGYKRVHVRTIIAELARRGLHMDGYFILSNAETTLEDLVEVFSEVARLKLRFPEHFHMRFPVVPHLVSYFTSASHRRHVRQGRAHVMKLRGFVSEPGHPEYDYPFVDHDVPLDAWVDRTVETGFVTDEHFYLGNLDVLRQLWRRWHSQLDALHPDRARLGRLLRALDDRPRRLVFEMLRQAWLEDDEGWPGARLDREACLAHAEHVLGPHAAWFPVLRHAVRASRSARLVVDGRAALAEAAALAASSDRRVEIEVRGPIAPEGLELLRASGLRVWVDGAHADLGVLPSDVGVWSTGPGLREAARAGLDTLQVIAVTPSAPELGAVVGDRVRLEPDATRTWSAQDGARLAQALFQAAPTLRGRTIELGEAGIAVDRAGQIGRTDGLGPDGLLAAAARLGALSDDSNLDRHLLDLGDPERLPGLPSLDVLLRHRQAAEQVVRRFLTWLGERGAEAAAREAG